MSKSDNVKIMSEQSLVTTAGVRVPLKTGRPNEVEVYSVVVKALSSNTDKIYIDDETAVSTKSFDLDPRESLTFTAERKKVDLSEIWLDSAVDGEGVRIIYMRD